MNPQRSPARACETCRELRDWGPAHGPDGLIERIGVLLELAETGDFQEVQPRYADPDFWGRALWSSVDRADVRSCFPDGPGHDHPTVPPGIAIKCRSCGRTFEQGWTWGRGNETWTVTAYQ